jgi:hypothetical protein
MTFALLVDTFHLGGVLKSSSYLVSDARLEITIDGAFHEDKL